MILGTILFLPIVRMSTVLKSRGDYDKLILNTHRVQAGQIFFLATAFILTWFYGEISLHITECFRPNLHLMSFTKIMKMEKKLFTVYSEV